MRENMREAIAGRVIRDKRLLRAIGLMNVNLIFLHYVYISHEQFFSLTWQNWQRLDIASLPAQ